MVRTDVTATASKAHGAHHGHDNALVSSGFATTSQGLKQGSGSVEESRGGQPAEPRILTMVKIALMMIG
jgi:hypothetical protein